MKIPCPSKSALLEVAPYIASESEQDTWGQPPISHYVFTDMDGVLHGQLISTGPKPPFVIEPQLELEFQAWDVLSDEALIHFLDTMEEDYTNAS